MSSPCACLWCIFKTTVPGAGIRDLGSSGASRTAEGDCSYVILESEARALRDRSLQVSQHHAHLR